MLTFLSHFAPTTLLYVVLAVVGVLAAALGVQTVRLSLAKAAATTATTERDAARGERDAAVLANASNTANVLDLQGRLTACVGESHRIEEAKAKASSDLDTANRDRARLAAQLKREREIAYAQDPACGAWRAAALCPAAGDGLRRLWQTADRHRDQAGGDAGSTVRVDPVGPDARPAAAAAADAGAGLPAADCYSNAQLFDALEAAVAWGNGMADQLDAIHGLSATATSAPGTGPGNATQQ